MSAYVKITAENAKTFVRGKGVSTSVFCSRDLTGADYTSGITRLPPGVSVPRHRHNCDEQVTLLQGTARVEVGDETFPLGTMETVFIREGEVHCFHNVGDDELVMFFVYDTPVVTRTFENSGETVAHLSSGDTV